MRFGFGFLRFGRFPSGSMVRRAKTLPRPLVAGMVTLGATTLAVLALSNAPVGHAHEQRGAKNAPKNSSEPRPSARVRARPIHPLLNGFNPLRHEPEVSRRGRSVVAPLERNASAALTLNPELQAHIMREMARYEIPYGAVVAIEPATGRILAYASYSKENRAAGDLVRDATPPAASVFKLVTAAALLDRHASKKKIRPDTRTCYGGGARRLTQSHLEHNPRRDKTCVTLTEAMASSANAVFAKLAHEHLDAPTLRRYASAFGFGHALPFDIAAQPSPAEVPTDPLEFARTAAGFWHMHMSPLHGATIAATIAHDGTMLRPALVDSITDPKGRVVYRHEPSVVRAVIPRHTARLLTQVMSRTVSAGTARSAFYDPAGKPFLPGVKIAGKTGSLTATDPYRAYSWWVGFAPAEAPTIALAALVVNGPKWRIKGSYLAREALRQYLIKPKKP